VAEHSIIDKFDCYLLSDMLVGIGTGRLALARRTRANIFFINRLQSNPLHCTDSGICALMGIHL